MRKSWILTIIILVILGVTSIIFFPKKKDKYGKITTIIRIYSDADKGISDVYEKEISKIFFKNKKMIEEIDEEGEKFYSVVINNKYSNFIKNINEIDKVKADLNLIDKEKGAKFIFDSIPDYEKRININDTIINNKNTKRFIIKDIENKVLTVFFIEDKINDTPYSINKVADTDYKGTLRRIDTYEVTEDRYIIIEMLQNDTIPELIYKKLNEI